MSYYIGADLGTSALKLLLVEHTGAILRAVSRAYPLSFPHSGWSEQRPEDWWDAFVSGIQELTASIDPIAIKGIGLGGQMHGLVILDHADTVIRPAILWNDGRTQKETDYLNRVIGRTRLSACTANIAFAGFTAPKLLWLYENEPDSFARINKIMLPKDYIVYRLTGVHSTDYSDAAGTLLLDVENKRWSSEMLDICHLSEDMLPQLYESFAPVGAVNPTVAEELGLSPQTVVAAGAGDNAAAAVGTNTVGDGCCNISLGTSGTVFIPSSRFTADKNNALHFFCHADGGYHHMGCILSAASCNKWLCEEIFDSRDYAALEAAIPSELVGHSRLYFLPYLMGERSPINDTDATGVFIGLRPDTTRAEMHLAVMEGVAFAIRDNVEVAKQTGLSIPESGICGGGSRSRLWLTVMASVLNIPLHLPVSEEGPGYGGAMLAMVAAGEYPHVTDCAERFYRIKETILPDPTLVALYEDKYQKYRKIYPALKPLYKEIKE